MPHIGSGLQILHHQFSISVIKNLKFHSFTPLALCPLVSNTTMTTRQLTLYTVLSSDVDLRCICLCHCPLFNCILLWKFSLITGQRSFASFNCFLLDHGFSTVPLLTFQIRSFSSYPGHHGCKLYAT